MKDIRHVVVHRPGPAWQPGVPPFRQPGLDRHVAHYRSFLEAGKLELGGPFLDADTAGMMVPVAGVARDEIEAFAAADPAVRDGLLTFEMRTWMIGMKR
jgi:uncharacterized protein YciI